MSRPERSGAKTFARETTGMCGRYGLTSFPSDLLRRLGSRADGTSFAPRYNIAPTQPLLAVLNDEERTLRELRWGLVPAFAASPAAVRLTTFNARIETIATARLYRDAFASTRCAVLASGYYEWRKDAYGKKTPLWIHREDDEPFAFAGLWATWRRGAEALLSCTILTQPPNAFVRDIHSRMPVVLRDEHAATWLDPRPREAETLLAALEPQDPAGWTARAVSARVGNVRIDDASLLASPAPASEPPLADPSLFDPR